MNLTNLKNVISNGFTENTLFEIIRKKTDWKNIKIENVELTEDRSKKGDAYLSETTRFKIFAQGNKENEIKVNKIEISVIAKRPPSNIARSKTFRCVEFFKNEINFYTKVWEPLLEYTRLKSYGVEELLPLCLAKASNKTNYFIALEDLNVFGFKSISRDVDLDIEHTKLIITAFAKFHAVSFAYKIEHPDLFDEITSHISETYFHEKYRNWYSPFLKNLIQYIHNYISDYLPEFYIKKFEEVTSNDFFGCVINQCAKKTKLRVVTHGDVWVPNFLMKYNDDGKPIVPVMIDFQLSRCSSLALDLLFFIYSCTGQTLRTLHFNELIKIYHKEFTLVLQSLGCDANLVTVEDIHKELKIFGKFGLCMSMEAVVMSLLDDEDVTDVNNIQGMDAVPLDSVWILHPIKQKENVKRIVDMVKDMIDRDFI